MRTKWISTLLVLAVGIVAVSPAQAGAATTEELNRMVLTLTAKIELLLEQNAALQDQLIQAKVELALARQGIVASNAAAPYNHAPLNAGASPAVSIATGPALGPVVDSTGHHTQQVAALDNNDADSDSDWYLAGSLSGAVSEVVEISASTAPPTIAKASLDPGFGVQFAVGNQLSKWYRLEGEVSYRRFGIDSYSNISDPLGSTKFGSGANGYVDLFTLYANAYVDGPDIWNITPYVGAGVGGFLASANGTSGGSAILNDDAVGPTLQLMAGVSYELNRDWDLTLGYRHLLFPDVSSRTSKLVEGETDAISVQEFGLGLRRNF